MFSEEAKWIEEVLSKIKPPIENKNALNLGSSTNYFREVIQSHIFKHVIQPLMNKGWKVINVDIKPLDGVDIIADVCDKNFIQ